MQGTGMSLLLFETMKIKSLIHLTAAVAERLHQFDAIPLKREEGDYYCGGSSAPTLYVTERKDSKVFDIAKEGVAKIAYRVRSKSVNYREDGTERYSTDIEVQSIEPTNLAAVLEKYDFSDRARDTGGRYAPGQNVSADDMADAYVKRKDPKRKALLVGAGVAGVAGAVAGRKMVPGISGGVGRIVRSALT